MDFPRLMVPGLSAQDCAALARTRRYEQYCRSVDDLLNNRCPFCELDRSVNRVELENGSWRVWQNIASPEANTRLHLLIVPKRHVYDLRELHTNEEDEFLAILRSALDHFGISSSGILIRNGDATLSAGTVRHLHVHVMVPDGTGRVESPFFKGEKSEAEAHARAIIFERLRTEQVRVLDLTSEERALVLDRL